MEGEFEPQVSKEDLSEDVKNLAKEFFLTGEHRKDIDDLILRRCSEGVNVTIDRKVIYVPCK